MYSKQNRFRIFSIAFTVALASVGCVKQRDQLPVQGSNLENLKPGVRDSKSGWKLNAEDNYVFRQTDYTINTGKMLKSSQDSVAKKIIIEPGAKIKHLDIVDFTSNHPLLQLPNVSKIAEMLGETNKTYPIMETLTPQFLIINKVVGEDQISFSEKTYSTKKGQNWIVPIGGFSVNYYKVENSRNDDNRPTNLVNKYPVEPKDFRTATHYEADTTRFIRFERAAKVDTLERNYFDGEWYFSETTVDVRSGVAQDVGELGATDTTFASATKIKFRIEDSFLVGDNTNIDERYKEGDDLVNQASVIKIPIQLVDYKIEQTNGEQLTEVEDDRKKESDRKFMKVSFLKNETTKGAIAQLFERLFGRLTDFKTLLEITYSENYVSFLVLDASAESVKRFSFRKVTANDKPTDLALRRYFFDDWKKFGVFFAEKIRKTDFKIATQEDSEKEIRMARHNPNKDIVYYFTDQTPKDRWYRDMGREAINIWSQAFQKAGLKINIRLDESKDVPLGDIRYNVLHIVNKTIGGNLGFGPSLTDADTGLIVSSSMNLTMEDISERHYRIVRNYLGRKSGKFYNFKDFGRFTPPSTGIEKLFSALNQRQYSVNESGQLVLFGFEGLNSDKTRLDPNFFSEDERLLLENQLGFNLSASVAEVRTHFDALLGNVHLYQNPALFKLINFNSLASLAQDSSPTKETDAFIDKNCTAVKNLAQKMITTPVSTETELSIIDPCVKILSQSEGLWATIHELGHNLGLMHNFRGSADAANYPKISDYKFKFVQFPADILKPKTSSTMDYLTTEGRQPFPGLYDIAAIRWIYDAKVELSDGTIVSVPTNMSLKDSGYFDKIKPMMYCSDYDRGTYSDPLCRAFDQGTNIIESVQFDIDSAYNALSYSYRYDSNSLNYPAYIMRSTGFSLKAVYDQWRGYLRKFVGSSKSYLEGFDIKSYQEMIQNISSKDRSNLEQFLVARNMIVNFYLDMAFLSNKYCLVSDLKTGNDRLIELEKIRTELTTAEIYSVVDSCKSPAAQDFIASKGATFKKEFGYFLEDAKFELDPSKNFIDPLDVRGMGELRGSAMGLLALRITPSKKNQDENFLPSLLDEPDIRNVVQNAITNRLLYGVPVLQTVDSNGDIQIGRVYDYTLVKKDLFLNESIQVQDLLPSQSVTYYANYTSELELVSGFVNLLDAGLTIAGRVDDGRRAYVAINMADPSQMEGIKKVAADTFEYLNKVFYVQNKETLGGKLMGQLRTMEAQKSLANFKPEDLAAARLQVMVELNKLGTLFVPLKSHSIRDLVKLVMSVNGRAQAIAEDNQASSQAVAFIMTQLIRPEMEFVFGFLLPNLQSQGISFPDLLKLDTSSKPEEKALADQILGQSIGDFYVEIKKQQPNLEEPTYAEIGKRFEAFLTQHTKAYVQFSENSEELNSQMDLLRRVILTLAQ